MAAVVVAAVLVACGRVEREPVTRPAPTATTTTVADPHGEAGPEHIGGSAAATQPLDEARRAALGLPPSRGPASPVGQLRPLTAGQWADPEAVAARFVLLDTNYAAGDDPDQLWARRAALATAAFAEDLRSSSSGAAGLAELETQAAVFRGEIVGLATVRRDATTAEVACSLRRTTLVAGRPTGRPGTVFYRLTLAHDAGSWAVAHVGIT